MTGVQIDREILFMEKPKDILKQKAIVTIAF